MDCDLSTSIPDWIIDYPETSPVFDRLSLDASCGGKSLEYVCHKQALSPQDVLEQLRQTIAESEDKRSCG